MTPKEYSSNGLSLEQELERRDRWLEDLQIRYKELQSKYEKLVAKSEPMKVKKVDFGLGHFEKLCPVCGEYQGFENDVRKSFEYPYCANCGQAIDWSDEK